MLKLSLVLGIIGAVLSAPNSKIDQNLLNSFASKSEANIIINFRGGNQAIINSIELQSFGNRADRLTTLKSSLVNHAATSQKEVKDFLLKNSVDFKSYWVSNQIYIRGASHGLVQSLAGFSEIAEIRQEKVLPFPKLIKPQYPAKRDPERLVEWGIERVQAQEAWQITNGTGVVVANIDSGVRHSHESLQDSYREEYGWFNPHPGGVETPNDPYGHGTHTLGSIVGSHGIGVSPGSKWVACGICSRTVCDEQFESALIECGQWMVCPTLPNGTNPDCSKAPNLVSNSWGHVGDGGNNWYEPVTEAWIAGGIVPLFSIGNGGPQCANTGIPGNYRRVIAVGSTNVENLISGFSSVGPGPDGRIKPDISAPGEDIRSALPDSDTSYGGMSGTSMSCPHAAGVTALLLSLKPDLSFAEVRQALIDSVDFNLVGKNATCSGRSDDIFPNHHFGYGMVNALNIVQNASK